MVIKNVALIGMGAIGSVYSKYLFDKYENSFAVIAGGTRTKKIEEKGSTVNGETFFPRVVVPEERGWKADLILVCVKNEQLMDAMTDIKNIVGGNTVLLSLLNGISSADKIREMYPDNVTLSGYNIGMDVARADNDIMNSSVGKLEIGGENSDFIQEQIEAVKTCLLEAGIVSDVLKDVNEQMWKRWLTNVGVNQVASILGLKYGQIKRVPYAVELMKSLMEETIMITDEINQSGMLKIALTKSDIQEAIDTVDYYPMFAKPSMLQDFQAKRKTEVDSFSGILITLAEKMGVDIPINKTIYNAIKSIEQMYHLDKIV